MGRVFKIVKEKKEGSDFSHKKGGLGKIGANVLKRGLLLIFIPTNPLQFHLSLSVWFVWFFLFIYTISIIIICDLQEEPSLTASNQQIYDNKDMW